MDTSIRHMKSMVVAAAAGVVLALLLLAGAAQPVFAATPLAFDHASSVFVNAEDNNDFYFTQDDSVGVASVVSADENVATAEISGTSNGIVIINAVSEGATTVTATGEDGSTVDIEVTVTEYYMKSMLKLKSYIRGCRYGSKKVSITSLSKVTGTLTVGSDKYKFKTGAAGEASVKLKKVYKLDTAVKCKLAWSGYTVTMKDTVLSATGFDEVKATKKKVKVDCYNLNKGDVVKLKYKGKVYTKKIKKKRASATLVFAPKHKVKKNASLTITIKNKYKQKLYKETVKLADWSYYPPDDDDIYSDDEESSDYEE